MDTYNRYPFSTKWSRDDAAARLDFFLIPAGASVLDVGCGDAWFAIELATRCHRVTGYESDPRLYQMAFECLTASPAADVTLRQDRFIGQEHAEVMLVLSVLHRLPVQEGLAWLARILPSAERSVCLELWLDDLPEFAKDDPLCRSWQQARPALLGVLKKAGFTRPTVDRVLPGLRTTLLQAWRWGKRPV